MSLDWENELQLTPEQKEKFVEVYWARSWFKTVTKKTWIENNYQAEDYCKDSTTGKQLCKTSGEVPLQVLIRYYLEYMTYDINTKYRELKVPTLILIPDFKGLTLAPDSSAKASSANRPKQFLKYYHQESWKSAKESGNPLLRFETVPDTRIFMWYDNPKETYSAIDNFLKQQ